MSAGIRQGRYCSLREPGADVKSTTWRTRTKSLEPKRIAPPTCAFWASLAADVVVLQLVGSTSPASLSWCSGRPTSATRGERPAGYEGSISRPRPCVVCGDDRMDPFVSMTCSWLTGGGHCWCEIREHGLCSSKCLDESQQKVESSCRRPVWMFHTLPRELNGCSERSAIWSEARRPVAQAAWRRKAFEVDGTHRTDIQASAPSWPSQARRRAGRAVDWGRPIVGFRRGGQGSGDREGSR